MPSIQDMFDAALLQQTFGDLRPGFLEHENFKGPSKSTSTKVSISKSSSTSRTIRMIEVVDAETGERRFCPESC